MHSRRRQLLLGLSLALATTWIEAQAERFDPGLVLDLRLSHANGDHGFVDGGPGRLRFGDEQTRARMAQVALLLDFELTPALGFHVQANVDAEPGAEARHGVVAPIEGFGFYRPALGDRVGLEVKAGLFFPPISFEHPNRGWNTEYTLTPSALNAWVGEEVRATGLEAGLTFRPGQQTLKLFGAAFGWNDPTGTLLAWRGWALHDRQTGAFQRLPLPDLPALGPDAVWFPKQPRFVRPVQEVDDRVGFYAGATWRLGSRFEVRALHFDNRGEPTALRNEQYAWRTRFESFGARLLGPGGVEVFAQYLTGSSRMGAVPTRVDLEPRAAYVLLTRRFGAHRLSGRWDWFEVGDPGPLIVGDNQDEHGSAWTAAYSFTFAQRQRLFVEYLSVEATRPERASSLGLPAHRREWLAQLALRLEL